MPTPRSFQQAYARTNYRIVGSGRHSAIKPCHWMIAKLQTGRKNRACYKEQYFGINSEQCIQNTPSLPYCNHSCVFCWRDMEAGHLGTEFSLDADDPGRLVEEFVKNQKNLLTYHYPVSMFLKNHLVMMDVVEALRRGGPVGHASLKAKTGHSLKSLEEATVLLKNLGVLERLGFDSYWLAPELEGGDPKEMLRDHVTTSDEIKACHERALNPSHAAISLAGEPTLYPHIDGLVGEFRKRGFTTFIVTNGTQPDVLASMESLPTQLYVTLPPPNEKVYRYVHRPFSGDLYARIQETLDLLPSLDCRKCGRITMVKGLNAMRPDESFIDGYVKLIDHANPDFVDVKGFAVEARGLLIKKRLGEKGTTGDRISEGASLAPTHDEVLSFAEAICDAGGYTVLAESRASRNVLIGVGWPAGKSTMIEHP